MRTLAALVLVVLFPASLDAGDLGRPPKVAGSGENPTKVTAFRISNQQELAQLQLAVRELSAASDFLLKQGMHHPEAKVRWAAAWVAGSKKRPLVPELVDLLDDSDSNVQQAARRALVRLSRVQMRKTNPNAAGEDFGPLFGVERLQRLESLEQWRRWWNEHPIDEMNVR